MSAPALSRRLGLLIAMALPLLLIACDTADTGTDTFFLPDYRAEFEFRFEGNDLSPTAFTDVTTTDTENLLAYIQSRGFTAADVVSARIKEGSGEIELLQPPLAGIGFMNEARLQLLQATLAARTVASASNFPATGDRAPLEIAGNNFADYAVTGPFSALLGVRAEPSNTTYRVKVSFDVVIEVEG